MLIQIFNKRNIFIIIVISSIYLSYFYFLNTYSNSLKVIHNELNTIPVVQIYYENGEDCVEFIEDGLWQAREYNRKVILLSKLLKCKTEVEKIGIEFVHVEDYMEGANDFEKIFPNYEHWSTRRWYELRSFQRWFSLRDYMNHKNISRVMYEDSDMLLFVDATIHYHQMFSNYSVVVTKLPKATASPTGSISYWTKDSITQFCNYIKEYYLQGCNNKTWSHPKWYRINNDMYLLQEWLVHKRNIPNAITLDGGFTTQVGHFPSKNPRHLLVNGTALQIKWIENLPHITDSATNATKRLIGVHFQGGSKLLMKYYTRPSKIMSPEQKHECICNAIHCRNCFVKSDSVV